MSFLKIKDKKYFYFLPLGVALVIAAIYLLNGYKDPFPQAAHKVGQPMPSLNLPVLITPEDKSTKLTHADTTGHYVVLNFFASWCKFCRREHETLKEIGDLARTHHFKLYGVNVRDTKENATRWLSEVGNPYEKIGFDDKGDAASVWGVNGTPSVFVLNPKGHIIYQYSGALTPERFQSEILPLLPAANHAPDA